VYKNGRCSPRAAGGRKYFDIPLQEYSRNVRYDDYKEYAFFNGFMISGTEQGQVIKGTDRSLITEFVIFPGITSLGANAYAGTGITEAFIPDRIIKLAGCAFMNCVYLEEVRLPNTITAIPSKAFFGCANLESITIPDGVTTVGLAAFDGCVNLTSLVIPASVVSFGGFSANDTIPENLIIYGEIGSFAETYAKRKNIPFRPGTPLDYAND
jgi:hypothetical protein